MTPDELLTHVLVDLAVDGVRLQAAMRQPKYRDQARELTRQLLAVLVGPPGPMRSANGAGQGGPELVDREALRAALTRDCTPVPVNDPLDPATPLDQVQTQRIPRVQS